MSEYDYICTCCAGSGTITEDNEESACAACNGYGHHLTVIGEMLIEFLKRRGISIPMSPIAEEELRGMIE